MTEEREQEIRQQRLKTLQAKIEEEILAEPEPLLAIWAWSETLQKFIIT